MIEPSFTDDLRLLANALRTEGFRFILVRHNRFSIYRDISTWLREQFANRSVVEFHFEGKDYRTIIDFIRNACSSIILIPDFDWLFREGNESICVGFNQRRDALAQLPVALICFVQPSTLRLVSKRLPDWWSLRSMELEFVREEPEITPEFLSLENRISSLGGHTRVEKEAELRRLMRQIETADPENKALLLSLDTQIGQLNYDLSNYDKALEYWGKSLDLSISVANKKAEGNMLNNISLVHQAKGDYNIALHCLNQSLKIQQEIGDYQGEGATLNNISAIYQTFGNYDEALLYLERSLKTTRQVGDRKGEGRILNNMATIAITRGDFNKALHYLEETLKNQQEIGDHQGVGTTFGNMAQIYQINGDYDAAMRFLEQSLKIDQGIGDRQGEATTLNNIGQIYKLRGEYEVALQYFERSSKIMEEIGYRQGEAATFNNIAMIMAAKGNHDTAMQYFEQSLRIRQNIGDINGEAITLTNIGDLLLQQNHMEESLPFFAKADKMFQQIGSPNINISKGYLTYIIEKIGQARFDEIVSKISTESR